MSNPYGAPMNLEDAKRVAAMAIAEARRNNWDAAVAIVDAGGHLVYFEKKDNTPVGAAEVAIAKARSAVLFKRPTKAFQDSVAAGGAGLRILSLPGAVPLDGGLPVIVDGRIIGGVGVSGDSSEHDGMCAQAGSDALKSP
jgi:glc operon protein GlcG